MNQPEQTAADPITRFLIQKPKAYAELDEMSRMAISFLTDEGWQFARVGMDLRVSVVSTTVIQEVESATLRANAELVQQLAGSELLNANLCKRIERGRGAPWMFALFGIVVASGMDAFGLDRWTLLLAAVCFVLFAWRRGGTKGAA